MEHGFMYVNGEQFRTVRVGGEVYIHASVIENNATSPRDPDARLKFFQRVDYLIATGMPLADIRPIDIPQVKFNTANHYLKNIKRIAKDQEADINTKRIIKWVREANCQRLLSTLLP